MIWWLNAVAAALLALLSMSHVTWAEVMDKGQVEGLKSLALHMLDMGKKDGEGCSVSGDSLKHLTWMRELIELPVRDIQELHKNEMEWMATNVVVSQLLALSIPKMCSLKKELVCVENICKPCEDLEDKSGVGVECTCEEVGKIGKVLNPPTTEKPKGEEMSEADAKVMKSDAWKLIDAFHGGEKSEGPLQKVCSSGVGPSSLARQVADAVSLPAEELRKTYSKADQQGLHERAKNAEEEGKDMCSLKEELVCVYFKGCLPCKEQVEGGSQETLEMCGYGKRVKGAKRDSGGGRNHLSPLLIGLTCVGILRALFFK